jgi:hypothetical protein
MLKLIRSSARRAEIAAPTATKRLASLPPELSPSQKALGFGCPSQPAGWRPPVGTTDR